VSTTTIAMGSFYDEKRATSELRKYRERGPIPSTRALIEALKAEGVEGATLLDIGGGIGPSSMSSSTPALPARAVLTPPAPISTRRARRAGAAAMTVASLICMATSSTWPTWSVLPRLSRSIESLTSIRAGNGLPDLRPARQAAVRSGLSARHPRGEAHHCRHESDAPFTEKAGARVLPFRRCDRADRPRERSDTSCRA
jgi:hypothetical protein